MLIHSPLHTRKDKAWQVILKFSTGGWPGYDVQIDRRHIPTLPDCIVILLQCSRLPVVSQVAQQGHHPAQWCVVSSQGQQRETAAAGSMRQ
jgi:hypothetical protein